VLGARAALGSALRSGCLTTAMPSAERQMLAEDLAGFVHDPLGAVLYGFPWGEGELATEKAPRTFQKRFLSQMGAHLQNPETRHKPFRKAISSGHGIGKSALLSWIAWWALSTFEDTKVILMAGTGDQLKTKTQPEVATWFRRALNADWFEVNVTSIKVKEPGHEQTWRADFVTWSEENPQASAGAHNKGKRLVIIFDEASGISDVIYKTIEGALTDADTEILWVIFSQCTRGEGAFFEAVFGSQRGRWNPEIIDSREVEGVNVEEINESIAIYGRDSDHVRVRYLGLFPVAGGGKFIDLFLVQEAQNRPARSLTDDPLIAGVDFAWGGADDNVVRFRKGFDGRSIPPVRVKGEFTKDPAVMVGKLADVLQREYSGERVAMMFVDGSGVGGNAGAIVARLRQLGHENIVEINFGHDAIDNTHYAYRRDEMWGKLKDWLREGGAIDGDQGLAADLQKPLLVSDLQQRVKLESKDVMKKRLTKMGLEPDSPDDADALALTFALPVAAKPKTPITRSRRPRGPHGWMA
jgi:hypothetical protein